MYKSHKYLGYKGSIALYFKCLGSKYNTMREIIILVSLVVCCVAAPTSQLLAGGKVHDLLLQRPSPINPDVPSDPKPDEKITKITNPIEIVKHERETEDNPYDHISRFAPTVHPNKQAENKHSQESIEHSLENNSSHHREKREKRESKETKKSTKVSIHTPESPRKTVVKKEARNHARSHNTPTTSRSKISAVPVPAPARDLPHSRQRRQVDPHLIGASTVAVAPLLHIDQNKKENEDETQHKTNSEDSHGTEIGKDSETLESGSTLVATLVKRDIPVPLVPKYHHAEESPKNNEKQEQDEKNKQQKHTGESDSKSTESIESGESHEDSKEKKSVIQSSNLPISQLQQPNIPAQVSSTTVNKEELEVHTTPISEPADKLADVHNATTAIAHINEPLVDQLASIKPTEIIAYKTPANKESVTIKHPIPVAELFSKHMPT